ncbi:MAG TPA: glycosyltransferase family A protein [Blastocatellia bacterium]|nr:glycosyltransferase family A protein [Blastocatellia bacterium]
MNNRPLVTVITVFLNAEKFIEEAVESVLAQTYGRWELLLVDDGSTDDSTEIALAYARSHPHKIRYLQHPGHENLGISASQNLGIREARGEYVAFLDADDVWESEKLSEQVEILGAHPEAAMVYGATRYWYSWTGHPQDSGRDLFIAPGVPPDSLVKPPGLLVQFLRQEIPIPCPSDVLARREAVIDVGGFEESFRRIFTDQAFYAKLCLKWPVFVAGRCWFKYRKHPESAVSVVKERGGMRAARLTYLNWVEGYLNDHGVADMEVRRALRAARRKCLHPGFYRQAARIKYRALIARESLRSIARRMLPAPAVRFLRAQRGDRVEQPR